MSTGTFQHSAERAEFDLLWFLENLDLLVEADTGIKGLRDLVIAFAVRGMLVPQLLHDGTSEPLGALIASRRRSLVNSTSIRTDLPPLSGKDFPHPIPSSWHWVRLGNLGGFLGGGTPAKSNSSFWEGPIPWVSPKDMKRPYISDSEDHISKAAVAGSAAKIIPRNSLLFVVRGMILVHSFPVALTTEPVTINQDMKGLVLAVPETAEFLLRACWGARTRVLRHVRRSTHGTCRIDSAVVEELPLPLPPIAEQKRIVSKVDEVFGLLDDLAANQVNRRQIQMRSRSAAIEALTRAVGPNEVAPAWKRIAESFSDLFDESDSITEMRGAILSWALRGSFCAKSNRGNALLEVRRRKPRVHPVPEQEHPYTVPANWTWVLLEDLLGSVTDGDHKPPPKTASGVPFLTIGNMSAGRLDFSKTRFVSPDYIASLDSRRIPLPGDILYTVVGSYGRPVMVDDSRPFCVQRHIAILRPDGTCDRDYLYLFLRSPLAYQQATDAITGTAQPTLPLKPLRRFKVPIPPIKEQRRVVARVQTLMRLCDDLEATLRRRQEIATSLVSSTVGHIIGLDGTIDHPESPQHGKAMKKKPGEPKKRRRHTESLETSVRRFVLQRFSMESGYRSLGKFDCSYHSEDTDRNEASPICLVGLNGSGKSNLIEAMAEVFCFLELINLPWKKVESTSSRYRQNDHRFELEYLLEDEDGQHRVQINKTKKSGADVFIVANDGSKRAVSPGKDQLRLLPRRIVGYSSGLNETVSHPFLRTKTLYSEGVREAAPPEGVESDGTDRVFDTRTLYMDYESNAAIILCNYIFHAPERLAVFNEFTRVVGVSSFGLRFNRKRAGKSGANSTVRLTSELKSFLRSFARCSGTAFREDQLAHSLDFRLTPEVQAAFRREFRTAENLFMAMHKWSLLNALILSDEQRKVYLKEDISKGALERPPSVPPSDRVFNIVDLTLKLSTPDIEIPYSGLSDGEHQFMQVFGTVLLFGGPGTLFLFDEPESHFNPEWRTKFNLVLSKLPNAGFQEYVISTHSPFLVSGSRKGNVFKFTRSGDSIACSPVDFETYGASFDVLLKRLFSMESMIDQNARQGLEKIIGRGDADEMQEAVENFAESKEKRRLYEAIIRQEEEQ